MYDSSSPSWARFHREPLVPDTRRPFALAVRAPPCANPSPIHREPAGFGRWPLARTPYNQWCCTALYSYTGGPRLSSLAVMPALVYSRSSPYPRRPRQLDAASLAPVAAVHSPSVVSRLCHAPCAIFHVLKPSGCFVVLFPPSSPSLPLLLSLSLRPHLVVVSSLSHATPRPLCPYSLSLSVGMQCDVMWCVFALTFPHSSLLLNFDMACPLVAASQVSPNLGPARDFSFLK